MNFGKQTYQHNFAVSFFHSAQTLATCQLFTAH